MSTTGIEALVAELKDDEYLPGHELTERIIDALERQMMADSSNCYPGRCDKQEATIIEAGFVVEAGRADLEAVAVALDEWDYATRNPTPSGDRLACSESVLRAVLHRPGVQAVLEAAKDG